MNWYMITAYLIVIVTGLVLQSAAGEGVFSIVFVCVSSFVLVKYCPRKIDGEYIFD